MNTLSRAALFSLLVLPPLVAQNAGEEPVSDAVLNGIQPFKSQRIAKPNEVTVVLDPPMESAAPKELAPRKEEMAPQKVEERPALVTGTLPDGSKPTVDEVAARPPEAAPATKAHEGLSVRVEKLKTGSGEIEASKVRLLAPFPAKPLALAPTGWRIESSENVPPFTREVELSPGKKITLSIRPHLLVPVTDGVDVFQVMDPGFDPARGYQQESTVGAILSNSIHQLEVNSKRMGATIDELQQLLGSLPKSEPPPPPPPAAPPKAIPAKFP